MHWANAWGRVKVDRVPIRNVPFGSPMHKKKCACVWVICQGFCDLTGRFSRKCQQFIPFEGSWESGMFTFAEKRGLCRYVVRGSFPTNGAKKDYQAISVTLAVIYKYCVPSFSCRLCLSFLFFSVWHVINKKCLLTRSLAFWTGEFWTPAIDP